MHELLLMGQLPDSRHSQVIKILAGVSAMQPIPLLEKHLIFKPNRIPETRRPVQVGGAQDVQKQLHKETQGDVYYLHLVGEQTKSTIEGKKLTGIAPVVDQEDHEGSKDENAMEIEANNKMAVAVHRQTNWKIKFQDIPEVVRQRPVTSRLVADIPIASGDSIAFMQALDYSHVSTYFEVGHRFTHANTSICLYRLYVPSSNDASGLDVSYDAKEDTLLDPSGAWLLQIALRVVDISKVDLVNRGTTELLQLKDLLKGVVNLDVADRLAMDTRAR